MKENLSFKILQKICPDIEAFKMEKSVKIKIRFRLSGETWPPYVL